MKRWALYLITVPLGLGILVYLVGLNFSLHFADIWSSYHQPKNVQRDVGKIPEGNAVPQEILRLRHKHQLRPLTEREEGTKIEELPDGIYGFSMCRVVALRATRGNTFSLEIQKHDGIMFYVGYASDEEIDQYLTRRGLKGVGSLFSTALGQLRLPTPFLCRSTEEHAARCRKDPGGERSPPRGTEATAQASTETAD